MSQSKIAVPSKSSRRKIPFGAVDRVEDYHLIVTGGLLYLNAIFESKTDARGLVGELVEEVVILRKLLMQQMRQNGVRTSGANEFNRELTSFAGKIQEHPDDIRAIVEPMMRQVFEEMLQRKPKGETQQRPQQS